MGKQRMIVMQYDRDTGEWYVARELNVGESEWQAFHESQRDADQPTLQFMSRTNAWRHYSKAMQEWYDASVPF